MTDTAANPPPFCYERRYDVSLAASGRALAEYFIFNAPRVRGSIGAESTVAELPSTIDEWRVGIEKEQEQAAHFTPRTERGRRFWALRQKYIAEGGRLYTLEEIQKEIAQQRGEPD